MNNPSTPPETATVTVQEAAKILGIGKTVAYAAAKDGRIPSIKVSERRILIPRKALEKLLNCE